MRITVVAALAAMCALAACSTGDNTMEDTTTIPGIDTTRGMAMPTTDTVVRTIETDTIQGEARRDSANADTAARRQP